MPSSRRGPSAPSCAAAATTAAPRGSPSGFRKWTLWGMQEDTRSPAANGDADTASPMEDEKHEAPDWSEPLARPSGDSREVASKQPSIQETRMTS